MMRTLVSDNGIMHSPRLSLGQLLMIVLFKCSSKHARHVFFIASLVGQFNHYAKHRQMAMQKLNAAMQLAFREGATSLPMAMGSRVWGGTGLDTILTETALTQAKTDDELRGLAQRVIGICPKLLSYASAEEMTKDLLDLLRAQREQIGEALPA